MKIINFISLAMLFGKASANCAVLVDLDPNEQCQETPGMNEMLTALTSAATEQFCGPNNDRKRNLRDLNRRATCYVDMCEEYCDLPGFEYWCLAMCWSCDNRRLEGEEGGERFVEEIERQTQTDPIENAEKCGFHELSNSQFHVHNFITGYIAENNAPSQLNSCEGAGIIVLGNDDASVDACEAALAAP
mmetsp:Transcript_12946/g.16958  ORF Transcript_12946/g.16958 Transcript_12946/m.16958 type:complete len:189 (-) Transcript_12946:167-733(-)